METLTTVLDSLDGVPEALQPFYHEEDGKHVLSLSDPKAHPVFLSIKATADRLDKELRDHKRDLEEAKDKLADVPDDFDADEYERLKEAGTKDEGELEERIKERLSKRHQRDLEKANNRADAAEGQLHTLLVDKGLSDALTAAKVATPLMEAAKALIKTKGKIDISDGVATIDNEDIGDFVKSWAESDGGKHFVAAPVNGGGGNAPPKPQAATPQAPTKEGSVQQRYAGVNFTQEAQKATPQQ